MSKPLEARTSFTATGRRAAALRSLEVERAGMTALIAAFEGPLGEAFSNVVSLLLTFKGRCIVSGMGKSGHIARKIAATLASTGTPSMFVHPAEASHGDLGMITADDAVILISNSGETAELRDILHYTQRFAVPLVAMTADAGSTLAKSADHVLALPKSPEACPNGLAPTTSTLLQLALGDALAVAILEERGFTATNFRDFHPGGKLGAALKHAADIMRRGSALPLVKPDALMRNVIVVMTEKACGCVGVVDGAGALAGIITDGDLRRHMNNGLLDQPAQAVMTREPLTVPPHMLAVEVLELLNSKQRTNIFVVDDNRHPVGLLHIHDLLRLGVG